MLVTPSAIREWWGANRAIVIPEAGGIWMAAWGANEDRPDYVTAFTISQFEPPHRILFSDAKYKAGGEELPFEMDMQTEFLISETPEGCELKVVQDGFPDDPAADEYYAACEKGWTDTFSGIRRFVESG